MARGGSVCQALSPPRAARTMGSTHSHACMSLCRAAECVPRRSRRVVCGCAVSVDIPRCALPWRCIPRPLPLTPLLAVHCHRRPPPEPLPLGISADTPRPAPAPLRTRREHAASRGRCLRTPAGLRSCCAGCSVHTIYTPCALPPALPPPYIYSAWPLCSVHPHHIPLPHPHPTTHTHTPWNTPRLHSASSPPPAA